MNSKQRRNTRVFVHEVTLTAGDRPNENYYRFDQRVANAKGWLQWQAKRKAWTASHKTYNSQTFKFRNGALAVAFALKWK